MDLKLKFHTSGSEKTTRSEQGMDCFNQCIEKMGDKKVTGVLEVAPVHKSNISEKC